jgi:hypothetical protein
LTLPKKQIHKVEKTSAEFFKSYLMPKESHQNKKFAKSKSGPLQETRWQTSKLKNSPK